MRLILIFLFTVSLIVCSNKYEKDALDATWISTDDTPTGRILTYELADKNYSRTDAKEIGKILLQKECESYKTQPIRAVLNDKFGNTYGILGLNCETNKYYGGLAD